MRTLLKILAIYISITAQAYAQEITFSVGQKNEIWAFKMTGTGRALSGDSLIYAKLDKLEVTNNPKYAKNHKIEYIELSYAYRLPDGNWNPQSAGSYKNINKTVRPGENITIHDLEASLTLKSRNPQDYWILVTIWLSNGETIYAHSNRDIFSQ